MTDKQIIKLEKETITIGQIKAIALLMTHIVKENNLSKEWTRGIEDFVERTIEYVKVCK
jgi:hypothetical protein